MDCEICDKKIVPGEKSGLLTREIKDYVMDWRVFSKEVIRFSLIPPPARWAGGKWRDSYIHHSCFLRFKDTQFGERRSYYGSFPVKVWYGVK